MGWQRTQGGGDFGEWKPAKVQVNGAKSKAKVTPKGEDSFVIEMSDAPENMPSGKWMLRINDDNEVTDWRPLSGMYRGKTKGFVSKSDEEPAPQTKHVEYTDKGGKAHKYDYQYFMVLIEITEGEAKGAVLAHKLRYKFAEVKEEVGGKERSAVGIIGHGKYTEALEDYLSVSGGADKPMPWSDNILPTLEKRILRADKEFAFVVKEGWINTFLDTGVDEEDF